MVGAGSSQSSDLQLEKSALCGKKGGGHRDEGRAKERRSVCAEMVRGVAMVHRMLRGGPCSREECSREECSREEVLRYAQSSRVVMFALRWWRGRGALVIR
jgi:hypothetical protein